MPGYTIANSLFKQESNLKDMLAYYTDKSKILQQQEPHTFEPIY